MKTPKEKAAYVKAWKLRNKERVREHWKRYSLTRPKLPGHGMGFYLTARRIENGGRP